MPKTDTQRLLFIDGLRGIAASMVMLYHLGDRTNLKPVSQWGYLGVSVFFIISGFVITSTLLSKTVTLESVSRFFARRFVRLDIPYWANIAITVILGAILYRIGGQVHYYPVNQVVENMLYVQGILGTPQINQVYWTLCLEIQFYLTLVFILGLAQRLRTNQASRVFQWFIIGSIFLSALMNAALLPSLRGLMFPYWWAFALGAMTCWWRAGKVTGLMLLIAFGAALAAPSSTHFAWRFTGVLTASLLVVATLRDTMGRWLGGPLAQFLGRISYSLYLVHALLGWEAQTFANRYVGPYDALVVGICTSILTAWFAYILIERPAIKLSHRIKSEVAPR